MATRTKLIIAVYANCIMCVLNVFSKPLHIPEFFHWVMIIGVFVSIGLMIHFIKVLKQEKAGGTATVGESRTGLTEQKQVAKRNLRLMMGIGCVLGLCAPLWLPLTGTSLGLIQNIVIGFISAAIICVICGIRLRKL